MLSIFCSFFYWRVNLIYDSLSQLELEVLKESDTTENDWTPDWTEQEKGSNFSSKKYTVPLFFIICSLIFE